MSHGLIASMVAAVTLAVGCSNDLDFKSLRQGRAKKDAGAQYLTEPDNNLPWAVDFSIATPTLLTDRNRNAPTMRGGWGPHLRGILTLANGEEWFAAEAGTSVYTNSKMIYYRRGVEGWEEAGSIRISGGVQQNMATITDGRYLYSYGVSGGAAVVVECIFDTTQPVFDERGCKGMRRANRTIVRTTTMSNYVGAAIRSDGTRIVWWSNVGFNGGPGSWSYTFTETATDDEGQELTVWHRTLTRAFGGGNSLGYVHARFDKNGVMHALGEMWIGVYPGGGYMRLATGRLVLGERMVWRTGFKGGIAPSDIWYDETSGTTHVLGRAGGGVGYFVATQDSWPKFDKPVAKFPFRRTERMRFMSDESGGVYLLRGDFDNGRIVVQHADGTALAAAIDWQALPEVSIAAPVDAGKNPLAAIWVPDPSKQLAEPASRSFAVCGSYPRADHNIWFYSVPKLDAGAAQ